jgi:hypothetical protein
MMQKDMRAVMMNDSRKDIAMHANRILLHIKWDSTQVVYCGVNWL